MTLKDLIVEFGKDKINTLTKYPSILTLHQLGEKGRLTDDFTTNLTGETLFATEKIDGTNVRVICLGDDYLFGSREFLLHHSGDLFFDPAQTIVESLRTLNFTPPKTNCLTVFYGELFGGKVTANSKQYGTDAVGFRVFDVAELGNLDILERDIKDISNWREHNSPNGLVYGQNFLTYERIKDQFPELNLVPEVEFKMEDTSHQSVLNALKTYMATTNVALTDSALLKPEGVILRNSSRTKIVKVRYEDYERTLK